MKTLTSLLFVVFFIGIISAKQNCSNSSYDPVCASKNGKYKTFPNQCEANGQNFSVQHEGPCLKKFQNFTECTARCKLTRQWVCAQVNGAFKTFVNECEAKCDNGVVVSNGTCNSRKLQFEWFKNLVNTIKAAVNNTERWVENKTQALINGTKTVWHQIGDKWEQCNCEPFNDVVNWAKKAANDTAALINRTKDEIKIIERNTIDGFNMFKDKVKEDLQKLKNATIDAAKKFINRTKEFIQKVTTFIHNVEEEAAEWLIAEGQFLKNKTTTWWHKTKEGIENCTCCLVEETEEVLDEIAAAADRAANKTKEKLEQLKDRLKGDLLRLEDKGEAALERTKAWFEALWPCICPKKYDPVCVRTDKGDQATILNHCYADCPKMNLTTVFNGTCEDSKNSTQA